uniref:Serine-tRNA synthetase type1 N-terminal domain-containing protein n=1 Tax=Zea mays TaxID=4577 RepID=B6UHX6_MAIZE|nr:hypothetical protein [Zea mays]
MLDINLFRTDKGGNPDLIHESQCSRFTSVELVDEVIALDKAWRERQFELDKIRQELNATSKKIDKLKAANNKIVRAFGEKRVEDNLKNHVDLCRMLDIVALEKGLIYNEDVDSWSCTK